MIFCSISFRGHSLYWEYGNYFPRWSQWMFWGLIIYVSSCNSQQIPVNTGLHLKAWMHHFPELLARMTWVWGEHIHILSFICGRGICDGFLDLTWPLTTSDSFVFSSARELQRWNIHFSSSFFSFFHKQDPKPSPAAGSWSHSLHFIFGTSDSSSRYRGVTWFR